MNCPYCGREVEEGKAFCECGRPVSLASGGGSVSPNTSFEQQLSTQTLASVQRKTKAPILPIIIIVLAALAAGVFFLLKFMAEKNIVKEDTWEVVDTAEYSVKLPTAMKEETEKMVQLNVTGSDIKKLNFFTCTKAAFYATARRLTDAEKEMYQGYDTAKIMELFQPIKHSVNGVEVKPGVRGNYIFYEYPVTRKNYISSTDNVWEIEAIYFTSHSLYELSVYCPEDEKDTYRESMLKWLDSFEPKNK